MTAHISVYDPTAPERTEAQQKRRTLDGLKGKVVGFVDNSKPNFDYLVEDMASLLMKEYGVKSTVTHRKPSAAFAASEAVMQDLTAKCNLVITGSGD